MLKCSLNESLISALIVVWKVSNSNIIPDSLWQLEFIESNKKSIIIWAGAIEMDLQMKSKMLSWMSMAQVYEPRFYFRFWFGWSLAINNNKSKNFILSQPNGQPSSGQSHYGWLNSDKRCQFLPWQVYVYFYALFSRYSYVNRELSTPINLEPNLNPSS